MSTPPAATPWVRREPQQARSRARVERLLEAADSVLASEGYEALTIRRIATQAQVPVGTLYQFFPDKQGIVDALAMRYLEQFATVLGDIVRRAERERWADPVKTLLESFIGLYRSSPGYLAIWMGRHLSPAVQRADDENNALIAEGIRRVLIAQLGLPDDEDVARACVVAVRVSDALLQYAFRHGPDPDTEVLAEMVQLQRLYLDDLVARHSTPPPRAAARR